MGCAFVAGCITSFFVVKIKIFSAQFNTQELEFKSKNQLLTKFTPDLSMQQSKYLNSMGLKG